MSEAISRLRAEEGGVRGREGGREREVKSWRNFAHGCREAAAKRGASVLNE